MCVNYLGQDVSRDGTNGCLLVCTPRPSASRLREEHGLEQLDRIALRPSDGGVVVEAENFRRSRQRQTL